MEAKMRNILIDQGFIYRVITPIFKINHLKLSTAIYMRLFCGWVVIKMIIIWAIGNNTKKESNKIINFPNTFCDLKYLQYTHS